MNSLTYCIVDYPATAAQSAAAIESAESVRKSLDESKCVLKWAGDTPDPFEGLATYTHAEILPIMHSAEWAAPEPEMGGGE